MGRRFLGLGLSLGIALVSSTAFASSGFPLKIQATLMSTADVPCIVCHDTDEGGKGSVNRAFGRRMVGYGLVGGDEQGLATLLLSLRNMQDDTDGDGIGDIDELKAGTNPNINDITGEEAQDYPPPVYGCHAGGRAGAWPRERGAAWGAACLVLAVGLHARLRRRAAMPRKEA